MAQVLLDEFVGASGTALSAHVSDSGHPWSGTSGVLTGAGRVRAKSGDGGSIVRSSAQAGTNVAYAEMGLDLLSTAGGAVIGPALLVNGTATDAYLVTYDLKNGTLTLLKRVGGAISPVGNSVTVAAAASNTLRLECAPASQVVKWNGATVLSATDASIAADANHRGFGLWLGSTGTEADAAGAQIASLTMGDDSVPPPVTLGINDAKLFASPYNWRSVGTASLEATVPGAYLKARFTGPSLTIGLDPAPYGAYPVASLPTLRALVDGVAQDVQLAIGQASWTLNGMSAGTHDLQLFFLGCDTFKDSWTPTNAVRVTGLSVPAGGAFLTPTVRPKRLLAFGDSITKGENSLATASGQSGDPTKTDASASYAHRVGAALNAEVGVVAYGGWGWENGSAGGVPRFDQNWDKYSAGQSRLAGGKLTPSPDYVTNNHGANGSVSAATVQGWLAAVRTALPVSTPIFVLLPFMLGRSNDAALLAGVAAYRSASGDRRVYAVDLGQAGADVVNANTPDAGHPTVAGHALLAPMVNVGVLEATLATSETPRATLTIG